MRDPLGRAYGLIELRKVQNGTLTRYKATHNGEVIGWSADLRYACWKVYMAELRSHGPGLGSAAPDLRHG